MFRESRAQLSRDRALRRVDNQPIAIDGLWGLTFGNNGAAGSVGEPTLSILGGSGSASEDRSVTLASAIPFGRFFAKRSIPRAASASTRSVPAEDGAMVAVAA